MSAMNLDAEGSVKKALKLFTADSEEYIRTIKILKDLAVTGFSELDEDDAIGRKLCELNIAGFVPEGAATYGLKLLVASSMRESGLIPSVQSLRVVILHILSQRLLA